MVSLSEIMGKRCQIILLALWMIVVAINVIVSSHMVFNCDDDYNDCFY